MIHILTDQWPVAHMAEAGKSLRWHAGHKFVGAFLEPKYRVQWELSHVQCNGHLDVYLLFWPLFTGDVPSNVLESHIFIRG